LIRHRDFLVQLESFDNESRNAARYIYANLAIQHAGSQSRKLLGRLNETPTLWLTVGASLQTSAYIALGRIFDDDSKYNIHRLLEAGEGNLALFDRQALAHRKRQGQSSDPQWLPGYLDKAHYPTSRDFKHLRKLVAKYHDLYNRAIRPARNKYIAHRERQEHSEVSELFNRGKVKDLWRISVFLQQLHEALWKLLHDGRKPSFRRQRYSIPSMFRKPPTGSSAHEGIVREVQKLMAMLERVPPNPALNRTGRRAPSTKRASARPAG